MTMRIGSLFSGIGGLELGLERAGLGHVVWQCEIDPFCRSVLAKHWPNAWRFEDVRSVDATAPSVDVICGGFPCQDVSLAGKRGGLGAPRSGLWHEFSRIIGEIKPSIVIVENVLGLRTSGLPRVLADLAALGFDAEWADLAAADVGAPHRRRRLFVVATHPDRIDVREQPGWLGRACRAAAAESRDDGTGWDAADAAGERSGALRIDADGSCDAEDRGRSGDARATRDCGASAHADGSGLEERRGIGCDDVEERSAAERVGGARDASYARWMRDGAGQWRPPVSPIRRVDDGIPDRSHRKRLKALGNAVVPQCAEVIGRAIVAAVT